MDSQCQIAVFMELLGLDIASVAGVSIDSFSPDEIHLFQETCTKIIQNHLTVQEIKEYLEIFKNPVLQKVITIGQRISPELEEVVKNISNKRLTPIGSR